MCLSRTINFYLHILLIVQVAYINFLLNEYDDDDDVYLKYSHYQ